MKLSTEFFKVLLLGMAVPTLASAHHCDFFVKDLTPSGTTIKLSQFTSPITLAGKALYRLDTAYIEEGDTLPKGSDKKIVVQVNDGNFSSDKQKSSAYKFGLFFQDGNSQHVGASYSYLNPNGRCHADNNMVDENDYDLTMTKEKGEKVYIEIKKK